MAVLLKDDEGKYLVDAAGEQFDTSPRWTGRPASRTSTPDPGVVEALVETFGGDADEDDIRVPEDSVEAVTDEEIRVPVEL